MPPLTGQPTSDEFAQRVEAESLETSVRAFNRVALLSGFVFLSPTVLLDSVGGAYDPWVRASHLILSAGGFLLAWITRSGAKLSPEVQARLIPAYVMGINLSQVIIMQRLREPLDVVPGLLTVVVLALVHLPLLWFVTSVVMQGLSVLTLASSAGWEEPWVTVVLIAMAVIAVSYAVFLNRRVYRQRFHSLRARQLASEAALKWEMEERARLQEREVANEKLQSLGRLAGGVAHDLNNLLVPIMGNIDLLLQGEPAPDRRTRLERVMDAAERARLLTRQLTAYAGKGGPSDEVFDLVHEMRETRGLVLRTVPNPLVISWAPPADPVWIQGDRAQVQQALLNLLLNAAEAVEGVESAEGVPDARVHLELNTRSTMPGADDGGPWACVAVRDEGPGIQTEDLGRIFDPFFTTKGSGRGLGLSAALGAAQRQGGQLLAGNSDEGGAEFTLYLRLASRPPAGEAEAPPSARTSGRILLVDDEEPVRDVGVQTLAAAGFDVLTSASGEEALAVVATTDLDAVVMDLRMPGLGGRETIQQVRALRPRVPILVCTGYGAEAAGWSEALDHVSVLTKPYRGEELVSSVSQLVAPHDRATSPMASPWSTRRFIDRSAAVVSSADTRSSAFSKPGPQRSRASARTSGTTFSGGWSPRSSSRTTRAPSSWADVENITPTSISPLISASAVTWSDRWGTKAAKLSPYVDSRPSRHSGRSGHSTGPPMTRSAAGPARSEMPTRFSTRAVAAVTTKTLTSSAGAGSSTRRPSGSATARNPSTLVSVAPKYPLALPTYSGTTSSWSSWRAGATISRGPACPRRSTGSCAASRTVAYSSASSSLSSKSKAPTRIRAVALSPLSCPPPPAQEQASKLTSTAEASLLDTTSVSRGSGRSG